MNNKRREAETQVIHVDTRMPERCSCPALSCLHTVPTPAQEAAGEDLLVPAPAVLSKDLRGTLGTYFPRSAPLSILLFHITQLEHIHIAPETTALHERRRYHAPEGFLDQVLANVKRTIRSSDQILTQAETAAALILPDVDQQGAYSIVERIYQSISLLQAETVIPPLRRETEILMGVGSYPEPGESIESLLYHAGLPARKFTLRAAIIAQSWADPTAGTEKAASGRRKGLDPLTPLSQGRKSRIPFMQLPAGLPARLKQIIPYSLALELRCAPVGRNHHCLTVAMADPTNARAIHQLRERTGMSIFPVSCDPTALSKLLATEW